jgi:hypothetical protein
LTVRAILLSAAFALFAPLSAFAFDVDFFVSSYETTVGGEVELRFTVFGADPGDTSIEIADVPSELAQSSSRKERQRVADTRSGNGSTSATVITQTWIAIASGGVTLGPFTLRVGGETATVPPVHIAIAEPRSSGKTELRWKIGSGGARTGEPLRITLEAALYGKADAVFCDAPENAILEALPLSLADGQSSGGNSGGSAAKDAESGKWAPVAVWKWTPLATGDQQLPVAVLEYTTPEGETRKAASPIFSVTVAHGTGARTDFGVPRTLGKAFTPPDPDAEADGSGGDDGTGPIANAPLPQAVSSLPDAGLASAVREHWANGDRAGALALLRHAEHARLFPRPYRAAREACEATLSIADSRGVPPAAWKQLAVIGSALFLSLALILRLASLKIRSFGALAFLSFALSLGLAVFAAIVYIQDRHPAGVTATASLYHVPEEHSTVVDRLKEGLPVIIVKSARDWLYVETPSSLRGWIPSSRVRIYTGTERP